MYNVTPVLNRDAEIASLRAEFFEALRHYDEGTGPLPHRLAERLPLRLDGKKWVLFATLDLKPLRLEGEGSWESVRHRVRDAADAVRRFCPVEVRWRESRLMQTTDGPHFRFVRLFVRLHDRDDARVLGARIGMREALGCLRLPPIKKARHALSLVPPPQQGHLDRVREERALWLNILGTVKADKERHAEAAAKARPPTVLRAVAGGRR